MGIKTYQEKNTKPMKKTRAQSGLPVKRKVQKTTRNEMKPALFHFNPIVVEQHHSFISSSDIDNGAESDGVVAAGDRSEDARRNVH